MDLSNEIMPKYYVMDPTEDDLLLGEDLRKGMVVLIESYAIRGDENMIHSDRDKRNLEMYNRWCMIDRIIEEAQRICFIGVYADGTKAVREGSFSLGWFVKLDSIPKVEDVVEKTVKKVSSLYDSIPPKFPM